jgi:hypothetical protein
VSNGHARPASFRCGAKTGCALLSGGYPSDVCGGPLARGGSAATGKGSGRSWCRAVHVRTLLHRTRVARSPGRVRVSGHAHPLGSTAASAHLARERRLVALVSLLLTFTRHLRRHEGTAFDTMAATLLLLQIVSGLTIAVQYRWASVWAEVTVMPYVRSLFRLNPSVILVAHMPFVIQLHVFCAFAILAMVPLSRTANLLFASVRDLGLLFAVVPRTARLRWSAVPAWTPVEVPISAEIHSDEQRQH